MTNDHYITSLQNARVKQVVALREKSAERRRTGLFVVEGRREVERCKATGYEIVATFYLKGTEETEWTEDSEKRVDSERRADSERCYVVSPAVYKKIAMRESTEGVVAVVKARSHRLQDLPLGDNPLVVVLERVEKPGNLGAVLRSADAAGVDAVIVCDPLTDLYNPQIMRSSTGAFFSVPTVTCSSEECISFLKERGISILTAQLQDSHLYYNTDMRRPTAIVMGTEATGLTDQWREAADAHIRIPMLGLVDSLNVSVSAAILMYEAVRQRTKVEG